MTYTPSGEIATFKSKYREDEQTTVYDYSKSKKGQPNGLIREGSRVSDNGNKEYIKLSDINYSPNGKVKSYTCVTNTTNAHESISNYFITDNYFAGRVEANEGIPGGIVSGGYIDNKDNYKSVLNKSCDTEYFDMDVLGSWDIQEVYKAENIIEHTIAKP